MRYIWIQN